MGTGKRFLAALTPFQILVGGYALITLFGAFLLSTPIATANGRWQNPVDALFVATSGISTTGLCVVDIGSFYTPFGQAVLLSIFQIGGLGYMAFVIFLARLFHLRTSLITDLVAKESLAGSNLRTLGRFFFATIVFAAGFELAGALALSFHWSGDFPPSQAIYLGFFHSVSAFCTAGFCLFPDSLMRYRDSVFVNSLISFLSLAGGIGFLVLYDVFAHFRTRAGQRRRAKLCLHSRLALTTTAALVGLGTSVLVMMNRWDAAASFRERVMVSAFQTISASTTDGFNTTDINAVSASSLVILMTLMFIGASPGSTGGGIKTSTFGVLILFLRAQIRGQEQVVNLFKRQIPMQSVCKAFGVFAWFVLVIVVDMILMGRTESAPFNRLLFEVVSALANTGLSTGITPDLSVAGRTILIATMFIGRVGPLAVGFFFAGRCRPLYFRYAEEEIFVG